ncbi:MAG: hypothetical protein QM757_26285 [Paludibaculum sp.]
MNSLSQPSPEFQAVGGDLLNGSGFETEDPVPDFDQSGFLTEEDSEQ